MRPEKIKNWILLFALLLIPGLPLLCLNQFATLKENYSVDTGKKVVHLDFSRKVKTRLLGSGWVEFLYGDTKPKRAISEIVIAEKVNQKPKKLIQKSQKVKNVEKVGIHVAYIAKFNTRDRKKIVKELRNKLGRKDFKRLLKGKLKLARKRRVKAPWTDNRDYDYAKKHNLIYKGRARRKKIIAVNKDSNKKSLVADPKGKKKINTVKTEEKKEEHLQELRKKELALFKPESTKKFTLVFGVKNKKKISTRLNSKVIDSPYKDYNLIQSPLEGDDHYYMLTNRSRDFKGPTNYRHRLKIIRIKAVHNLETGLDSFPGKTEFLKGLPEGDKIGFGMFYNSGKFYVVYSIGGTIYQSSSVDGLRFKGGQKLNVNSRAFERDPAISSDGKMIAFASNRHFLGNKKFGSRGYLYMHTYIAFRASAEGKFGKAIMIKDSLNLNGLSFPVILRLEGSDFVLFHRNTRVNTAFLCSSEIRNKRPIYPVKVKVKGIPALWKYLSMSGTKMRGRTLFVSYRVKSKNFDQAHVRIIKLKKVKTELLESLAEE